MADHTGEILTALRNLEGYGGVQAVDIQTQRLGGLTNLVYRVELDGQMLIVRIPGEGTSEFIDRKVELHNARAAAAAGVAPDVIWANGETGVMISRCLDPVDTMTPALFKSKPGTPSAAGEVLARLHNSGQEFQFRFELFAMIDDYLDILSGKTVDLPEGYYEIVAAAQPVKQTLADNPTPLAPCHCDPLCENFLDDFAVMWMVDWEYSGMNDPMWDLADLSVEAGFDDAQDNQMFHAYFDRGPTAAELGRMVIYKAMCDLLWTLWGLIQLANNNLAEDFRAYADTRFTRCQTLMNSESFPAHLRAITAKK